MLQKSVTYFINIAPKFNALFKINKFRAGQGIPRTKEEIYSAMIVLGFLSYSDGYLRIPNKEVMKEFEKALKDKAHENK